MISRYIEKMEEAISSSPIIVSSSIQKYFGPSGREAYSHGKLTFIDLSTLEFSIFVIERKRKLLLDKYRFQYMDSAKKLIFRYDNAPHHKEIPTFPMHKHLGDKVIESTLPDFKELMEEISTLIIQSMK